MNLLDKIFETKREEVEEARRRVSDSDMAERAAKSGPPRGFRKALASADRRPALIAEVKQASPSKGVIRPNLNAAAVARAYGEAGAQALSVLTDSLYFQGSAENLARARAACDLPVLRKDFVFDTYQILEARAMGADAVLLIAAYLTKENLLELLGSARSLGMDALVEVHSAGEAEVAVEVGADLVGINNRNLADFTTDLAVTEALAPSLSRSALVVSESALGSREDVERVRRAGASAVLIGTSFCASPDVGARVREVMGW